jgi:hypothetical protein
MIQKAQPEGNRISILFLGWNPSVNNYLQLEKEVSGIRTALANSAFKDRIEFHYSLAVTGKDITRLILERSPSIVHFSGMGGDEGIFMEDETGEPNLIPTHVLADVFSVFKRDVKCVFMNASDTIKSTHAIAQSIDYVIGVEDDIRDSDAIAFSSGFYEGIAAGKNYEDSFELGNLNLRIMRNAPGDYPKIMLMKKKKVYKAK